MKTKRWALPSLLGALAMGIAGCTSMEQAAQKECVGLGLTPGTGDYANCYQQSMIRRQSAINALNSSDN